MLVSVVEDNIGMEIVKVQGDVPNKPDFVEGTRMSLESVADLLYLDGDFSYIVDAVENEDGFSTITIECYAFGEDEDTPVGKITTLCGVSSDLGKICRFLEGASK